MYSIAAGVVSNLSTLTPSAKRSYIINKSKSLGLDSNAVLSVVKAEGNFAGAIGDNGTSYGPFQLHKGGALPTAHTYDAQIWSNSKQGIDYALEKIANVAAGLTGAEAIDAIVRKFERPKNPTAEVIRAIGTYNMLAPGMDTSPKELQNSIDRMWGSIGKNLMGGSRTYDGNGDNGPSLFTQIVTIAFYPLIIAVAIVSLYMIFNPNTSTRTVVSNLTKGVV